MNTITKALKPKPAKSLGHAVRRAAARALLVTVCLGGSYAAMNAVHGGNMGTIDQDRGGVAQTQTVDKAGLLVQKRCADYAEGTIPGHAVVTLPGQAPRYVASQIGFDLWGQDQEFGTADDLPGTLHAFCR